MPVYESIKNADNRIVVSGESRDSVVFGWEKVIDALAEQADAGRKRIALDGWYGIGFEKIARSLEKKLKAQGRHHAVRSGCQGERAFVRRRKKDRNHLWNGGFHSGIGRTSGCEMLCG